MTVRSENTPRRSVGVWIDHREAVLVFATETDEEVVHIASDVERHPGPAGVGSTGSSEAHHSAADDIQDRRFSGHLAHFYDEVIAKLDGAESILVLGPGEAKGELSKELEKTKGSGCSVSVEAASRMSDGQLVKKVRAHFHPGAGNGARGKHHLPDQSE